jgi:hypothetical protein
MSIAQKLFFAISSGNANQKSYRSMHAIPGEAALISIHFERITTLSGLTTYATPDSSAYLKLKTEYRRPLRRAMLL